MTLATCHIIGKWIQDNGLPSTGSVTLTRSARMTESGTSVIIEPDPKHLQLDGNGSIAVDVIATDIVTLNPAGVTYTVVESIDKGNGISDVTYNIPAPEGDTIDLATVTPVSIGPTGIVFATEVDFLAHINDAIGAHASTAISFDPTGMSGLAGATTAQAAIAALYNLTQAGQGSTTWTFSGNATITTSKARSSFRGARTLTGWEIDADTAPVGSGLTVDLLKNGTTSVFSVSNPAPTIVAGAHHAEVSAFTIPNMADDDFVVPSVTAIGSTTPGGNDLTCRLYWA